MGKTKCIKFALIIIAISVLSAIGYNTAKDRPVSSLITAENTEKAEAISQDGTDLININNATEEELDALPGIGPERAAAIVEQRKKMHGFHSVEDLLCVDGIGEQTLEKILPLVCAKDYTEE